MLRPARAARDAPAVNSAKKIASVPACLRKIRAYGPATYCQVALEIEMRKNKIADFQLLKIDCKGVGYQEIYKKIVNKIRASDILGAHKDENCYLLLSQADEGSVVDIIKRLGKLKNQMEFVDLNQFDLS